MNENFEKSGQADPETEAEAINVNPTCTRLVKKNNPFKIY